MICKNCEEDFKFEDLADVLSIKEYLISGYCQICQDEIFLDNIYSNDVFDSFSRDNKIIDIVDGKLVAKD